MQRVTILALRCFHEKNAGKVSFSSPHAFPFGIVSIPHSAKSVYSDGTPTNQAIEIPLILFQLSDRDRLIVRMFLVLGLRPGEMFALRWNDKEGNSLRIDSSITEGMEVETKTEGSDSYVWLPASIDTELGVSALRDERRIFGRIHLSVEPRHRYRHE